MDIGSMNSRRLNKHQQEQSQTQNAPTQSATQSNTSWTKRSIISLVLFILVVAFSVGFILKETERLIRRGSSYEYRLSVGSGNESKVNATSNGEQANSLHKSSFATNDRKPKSQSTRRAAEPKQNQEEESKNRDDHPGSSKSPNESTATNHDSAHGRRTSNPIRTFSFPEENKAEYEEIMKPARVLTSRANLLSQQMDDLHAVAKDMDTTRGRLPPNAVSRHIPTPETVSFDFHRKRHDNFLWGPPDFRKQLRDWQRSRCINESRLYVNSADIDQSVGPINTIEALVQRSFQLQNVTYKDELYEPIFSKKGKVFEYPYCDLRKCPQHRFPFIYLLVPHRNRVGNLLRFVSSVRNATLRCNELPPWYHCLCIYVSDYDTDEKVPLASELEHAWRDRVRLLSRSPATYHWIKTQTYNSGLRYIPTPSTRSLVFHVDADMLATDSSFVDRGLATTLVGKRVSFPKVMGTKSTIKDSNQLFQHVINKTLMNKENAWVRYGGFGMTWFYLFDDNVGFFGSTINKTTWGGEDNLFYEHFSKSAQKHEMKMPSRYKEESLWHIWHKQFMNWRKSKDGISIDRSK